MAPPSFPKVTTAAPQGHHHVQEQDAEDCEPAQVKPVPGHPATDETQGTASPEKTKGELWFPAYNAASTDPEAFKRLGNFIADDAVFFQGVGGTTLKAQYMQEAKDGTFAPLTIVPGTFDLKRIHTFKENGQKYAMLAGTENFDVPKFGLKNAPATVLNIWRLEKDAKGHEVWRMVTHLSAFDTQTALQPAVDAVVDKLNNKNQPNAAFQLYESIPAPFFFTDDHKQYQFVAGKLTMTLKDANGKDTQKVVDALVLARKDAHGQWVVEQSTARAQ